MLRRPRRNARASRLSCRSSAPGRGRMLVAPDGGDERLQPEIDEVGGARELDRAEHGLDALRRATIPALAAIVHMACPADTPGCGDATAPSAGERVPDRQRRVLPRRADDDGGRRDERDEGPSTLEVSSSRGRARAHRARAEPGRSRAPAAPRAFLASDSSRARAHRWKSISTRRTLTCGSILSEGFRREDLTRALERRSVVQATLMRGTIHVVSKRDFWVRGGDQGRPARVVLRVRKPRPDERELEWTAHELRRLMASRPRRREELAGVVGQGWGSLGP